LQQFLREQAFVYPEDPSVDPETGRFALPGSRVSTCFAASVAHNVRSSAPWLVVRMMKAGMRSYRIPFPIVEIDLGWVELMIAGTGASGHDRRLDHVNAVDSERLEETTGETTPRNAVPRKAAAYARLKAECFRGRPRLGVEVLHRMSVASSCS